MGYCSKEISGPYPGEDAPESDFFFSLQCVAMPKAASGSLAASAFY
jgi:hypothetical protein